MYENGGTLCPLFCHGELIVSLVSLAWIRARCCARRETYAGDLPDRVVLFLRGVDAGVHSHTGMPQVGSWKKMVLEILCVGCVGPLGVQQVCSWTQLAPQRKEKNPNPARLAFFQPKFG